MSFFKQDISKKIFKTKYMIHEEKNEDEVFKEIANEIGNNEEEKINFYNEIKHGRLIPAGRILANARSYSKLKNYLNCFVISIKDSMEGIFDALKEDAIISKMGGGVGFNISSLRPKNDVLSTGGTASGPVSFLKIFDRSASIIHTGGHRRAAHLAVLNVNHPDIEEFITCKQGDNNKELTQFNLSVGITDEFISCLEENGDWVLQFEGKPYKTVKAKSLYNKIVKNGFSYNEPGILNIDNINYYSNSWYLGKITSTNPCFTGNTIIAVADGRNGVTIKNLCKENEFLIYSARLTKNKNFKKEIKKAKAFKTGEKEVIEIILSDGSSFKCTPDHFLATNKGEWVRAQNSKNITLQSFIENNPIYVKDIKWNKEYEDVYDITVEDNHNFFIIIKIDDEKYSNSYGCLVHNCAEEALPPYSACCLSAINLPQFIIKPFTNESSLDWNLLKNSIINGIRFLDNVIDKTDFPLDKIKEQVYNDRRVGLGFTGLADMFAMLTLTYGDEKCNSFLHKFMQFFRDTSYKASIELAKEKEPFPLYDKDKFLESNFIKKLPTKIKEDIKKYGIRNTTVNTIAPTGSTAVTLGQNCSSGIEPIFSLEYKRNIRKSYETDDIDSEKVFDYAYLLFKEKFPNENIPDYFITTLDIEPIKAIEVQSICQEYLDASISKTLNLPAHYKIQDYKNLYLTAYKKGLKGFTTFKVGSQKGVLELNNDQDSKRPPFIKRQDSPKRPKELPCDIYEISVYNERHIILVGKLHGTLYEIFVTHDKKNKIDKIGKKDGIIRKVKKGQYQLIIENGKESIVIDNISEEFDSIYASLSRFISMSLRHGVNLQFIVSQLQKDKNFLGFEKSVARILKKYIKSGEFVETSKKCSECGGNLVYEEGCIKCVSCGSSLCE